MPLTLESQLMGDVVVIRCKGRIVAGAEVDSLQAEFEKQIRISRKVVLQLAETDYVDSSGLGALVRVFSVLKGAGGDLKMCHLSPRVLRVLEMTNLLSIFHTYPSEKEAIAGFSQAPGSRHSALGSALSSTKIVCVDTSRDLLAYLNALLRRSGYEVFTTRVLDEATTLVYSQMPHMVICGPGMLGLPTGEAAVETFRNHKPSIPVLLLPPDFSTAEAGQAGVDLVNRVQSLLED
jgi:anti-sigma B factor antagonist